MNITFQWANQLAKGAPIAQNLTKQLVQQATSQDLISIMDLEALAQDTCTQSEDCKGAIRAFLEKRKPTFRGL